jgi:endonuclease-8
MPEGPQMIFLKEQVAHFIGGNLVEAKGAAKELPFNVLKGQTLIDIRTFGKELLFCFPDFTIGIHLMLFGKFAIDNTLKRQLRLGLTFENGEINFYECKCTFIEVPLDQVYDWSIDVMNIAFNRDKAFEKLTKKPGQLICEALLDQNILAGVGNKIKNEVLFTRQVHPESVVGEIPPLELRKLIDECVKLSFEYLEWKREGSDDEHWQVYRKKECIRDKIPLQKQKIGKSKRSCYFCDRCQVLYVAD